MNPDARPEVASDGSRRRGALMGIGGGLYFLLFVGAILYWPAVPFSTHAFIREKPNASLWTSVTLAPTPVGDGTYRQGIDVEVLKEARIEDARTFAVSVDLFVDEPQFYGSSKLVAEVVRAEARLPGGDIGFQGRPGVPLRDNRLFEFERVPGAQFPTNATPTRLRLEWVTRGEVKLALKANRWTGLPPDPSAGQWHLGSVIVRDGQAATLGDRAILYLTGQTTRPLPGGRPRRIELLAYVWDLPGGVSTILGLVILGAVGVGLGLGMWPRAREGSVTDGAWMIARSGFAAALVFAGFGWTYAVTVPPFHTPDEPVHFLAYAALEGRSELREDALRLARRGHFERIKYRYYERFSAVHQAAPEANDWNETIATELHTTSRYSAVVLWWRLFVALTPDAGASATLLSLRCANAILVATAFGFGVALWVAVARDSRRQSPGAIALLFIPTLPFLSMHVSNYVLVFAGGTLLGAAWLGQWIGERRRWLVGLGLGLGIGIAAHSARSALTLVGLLPCLLGEWLAAALGEREGFRPPPRWWAYWLALAGGVLLSHGLVDAAYRQEMAGWMLPRVPGTARGWLEGLGFVGTVLAAASLLAVGHLVAFHAGRVLPEGGRRRVVGILGALSCLLSAAIALILLWYTWAPIPTFTGVSNYPEFRDYLARTFSAFWSSFGFGDHDFLTSLTFWANFGWMDTPAPNWLVSLLAGGFCLGLCLAFWQAGRESDGARLGRLLGLVLGWLSYFVCLAAGAFGAGLDVGGRYATVLYFLLVVVGFQGWVQWVVSSRKETSRVGEMLLLAPVVLHAGCLSVILARYF